MIDMARKKPVKRPPSRDNVEYVGIPAEWHAVLKQMSDEANDKAFSINYFARQAVREYLERLGKLPPPKAKPGS